MKVYVVQCPTYCGHGDYDIVAIFKNLKDAEEFLKTGLDYSIVEWNIE